MSREILFRGKTDNKWVYGVPIYLRKEAYIVRDFCLGGSYTDDWVEAETVGQFTGLIDKNGKKIFEGDILKAWYSSVEIEGFFENLEVYYDDSYAQYRAGYKDLYEVAENSEVVGNIHDNPELLQEK